MGFYFVGDEGKSSVQFLLFLAQKGCGGCNGRTEKEHTFAVVNGRFVVRRFGVLLLIADGF